jgi:hypothetical protein
LAVASSAAPLIALQGAIILVLFATLPHSVRVDPRHELILLFFLIILKITGVCAREVDERASMAFSAHIILNANLVLGVDVNDVLFTNVIVFRKRSCKQPMTLFVAKNNHILLDIVLTVLTVKVVLILHSLIKELPYMTTEPT